MSKHIDFSAHVMSVFNEMETDYDAMNNLMTDVALGKVVFDEESGREISKAEAEAKILDFSRKVMKISDIRDRKHVRRAVRDNARAWFDCIEDTLSVTVKAGLEASEWFQILVEEKTINYGDRQDFYAEDDGVLAVSKIGESHHDHILQRLMSGQHYSIPVYRWGVKIGEDVNKYILGETSWEKMVSAITKAFILKIQEEVYAEVKKAVTSLPADKFKKSGDLVKEQFDEIIENVSSINGTDVIIMGTKTALKKLNKLTEVDWISASQKEQVANTGILGSYEGVKLIEIPQRFKDKTLTTKLFSDKELYIIPNTDNRFIKFVDEGDQEITEVTEKGEANGRQDDLMTLETQRRFGVAAVLAKHFGAWIMA